jgi:hypothetical protein
MCEMEIRSNCVRDTTTGVDGAEWLSYRHQADRKDDYARQGMSWEGEDKGLLIRDM